MSNRPIMVISGTNRPDSNTLKLARLVEVHYRSAEAAVDFLSLADLPLEIFQPDAYAKKPPAFESIQRRVLEAAGLHIILPEYNGSFPGVLKYFIDMLKFPESFDRKPVAFIGLADGSSGALRAVEQLQMVFGYRNAHVYPERVFIAAAKEKFTPEAKLNDPAIDQRIHRQVLGFAKYAKVFASGG